jgi:hypothetical protein
MAGYVCEYECRVTMLLDPFAYQIMRVLFSGDRRSPCHPYPVPGSWEEPGYKELVGNGAAVEASLADAQGGLFSEVV